VKLTDADDIVKIDKEVIGDDSRRDYIQTSISDERCLVVKENKLLLDF
jgi:hypothetical protein